MASKRTKYMRKLKEKNPNIIMKGDRSKKATEPTEQSTPEPERHIPTPIIDPQWRYLSEKQKKNVSPSYRMMMESAAKFGK